MKKVLIPEYLINAILSPDLGIASDDKPGSMNLQVAVSRARGDGEKVLDTDTHVDQATRASSYFPYPSNGWIIHEDENDEVLDTLNLDTVSNALGQLIENLSAINDNDVQVESTLICIKKMIEQGLTKTENDTLKQLKETIKSSL